MVDEADEANFGQQAPTKKRQHESSISSPGPRKRKPGNVIHCITDTKDILYMLT
jgi:hypothetical protein